MQAGEETLPWLTLSARSSFAPTQRVKTSMQNHCANPECRKPLRNLNEGRLFVIDDPQQPETGSTPQPLRCYWLCAACSESAPRPVQQPLMPQGQPSIQGQSSIFADRSFMAPFLDQDQPVFEEHGLDAYAGVAF